MTNIKNLYKILLVAWCMILYCFIHTPIESFFIIKLSFLGVVYEAFKQSICLQSITSIIVMSVWIVWIFSSIKDRNISYRRCLLDAIGIEILLLADSTREALGSGFGTISLFCLIAMILMLDILVCLLKWLAYQKYDKISKDKNTFICDNHDIVIIDSLRKKYAEALLDRLRNVDNNEEAFALIVYGDWGSGKTLYLRSIEDMLKAQEEIVLSFNPWDCHSEKLMLNSFFNELEDVLSEYDSSLMKPMIKYVDLLTSLDMPKPLDALTSSIFGKGETSVNHLKNEIRDSLNKIGKSVYVLIDDLDRLTKSEIFEMLRLIRNTANFPYLKFIVTCDRKHIVTQLKELNIATNYLEKIFMMEISLPQMYQDYPCVNRCKEAVLSMTDDISLNNEFGWMAANKSILLEKSLKNLRQAERFARSLVLNWTFAKENTIGYQNDLRLSDFLWIELLKITNNDLYEILKKSPETILDLKINKQYKQNMFVLKSKEELSSQLYVKDSINILYMLFPYNVYFKMVHNSIALEENYYKYFNLGKIHGHISKADFLKLLNNNYDTNSLEKKTQELRNSEWKSIFNLFFMLDLNKLASNAKERFVDFIYLYYKRYRDGSIHTLIKDRLKVLLQFNKDQGKFKEYIYNRLSNSKGNNSDLLLSNIICKYFIEIKLERNEELLDEQQLKAIIMSNFKYYIHNNDIDASDLLKENSFAYDLLKESVVAYAIFDNEGRFVFDEYNSIVHDTVIEEFENKKSKNKKAIKTFEFIEAENGDPQELIEDLERQKEIEIDELFGSSANYNEFKNKCFENSH